MNASGKSPHSTGLIATISLSTAVMIVMGNVIGSGVFKKAAPMAADLGSPGLLLLCWVIAGAVTLAGALAIAEVAGIIASPGGLYTYFREIYGRFFGFMYGWMGFVVIQCASIASIGYVFGQSANSMFQFPRLGEEWEALSIFGIFYPLDNLGVKAFTIATLAFITAANYFGVKYGGLIANISMAFKLGGLTLVIVLGLAWSGGSISNFSPFLEAPGKEYGSSMGLFGAMFGALLGAFWAYDGWVNITFLGAETRNPKRNIPLALGFGVLGVIVIYTMTNVAYLHVMPVEKLAALTQSDNSIAGVEVMRSAYGDAAATCVAVLILFSTFGATNASVLLPARMYFTMARDGLFFRRAATCHPKYNTPSTSLVMQCVWASVLVMSGSFDQLTDMVVFASFISYGAGAFAVFRLRRTRPDAERQYRVHGYPVLPALFVAFCAALVIVTVFERPRDAGIGLALILSGIPFYLYWNSKPRAESGGKDMID